MKHYGIVHFSIVFFFTAAPYKLRITGVERHLSSRCIETGNLALQARSFCSSGSSSDTSSSMHIEPIKEYKCIELTFVEGKSVGLITLNRPKVLNALSDDLMHEIVDSLQHLDSMQEVLLIVHIS